MNNCPRGYYKVRIRRGDFAQVKPEAESLDNRVFEFEPLFTLDECDLGGIYEGEKAMGFVGRSDIPITWIASGDLELVEVSQDE